MFFYPSKQLFHNPGKFKLEPETISFRSQDGTRLFGWFFKSRTKESKAVVLQFHGNGENMSSHYLSLVWLISEGYDVFTFDYREYGLSEGEADLEGAVSDSVAAIEWVSKHPSTKDKNIVLFGQSIGGALALNALESFKGKEKIAALVIDSSFLSFREIARHFLSSRVITWPFQPLVILLIPGKFHGLDALRNRGPIPLLVIHGTKDKIVPLRFGQHIYQAATEPKELWLIENGEHIDSMTRHKGFYREKLVKYLDRLFGVEK